MKLICHRPLLARFSKG